MPDPNPPIPRGNAQLAALRARLALSRPQTGALPLGVKAIDAVLGGGLPLAALHEIAPTGADATNAAVPAAFAAFLLARLIVHSAEPRPVAWIGRESDLYPPGLLGFGLDPGRLIMIRIINDNAALLAMQRCLGDGAMAGVVAEAGRLDRLAARRLKLACERGRSTGLLLRRFPRGTPVASGSTAPGPTVVAPAGVAACRWRIGAAPSVAQFGEPGPPRWRLALLRGPGGQQGEWTLEYRGADDAAHPLRLVAALADEPAPAAAPRYRDAG